MRSRRRSMPQVALPIATTGTARFWRRINAWMAGKIFRYARSPVAPNSTSASEAESAMSSPVLARFGAAARRMPTDYSFAPAEPAQPHAARRQHRVWLRLVVREQRRALRQFLHGLPVAL